MQRTLAVGTKDKVGEKVLLKGWVNTRRDHGKLVFIDLRDRSGIVQVVGGKELGDLRPEDVVEVFGEVKKRPENLVNSKIPTGEVEVRVEEIKVLAKSDDLPFPIEGDGYDIDEAIRLKYRYLDLRRPRLKENLLVREKVIRGIRGFLSEKGFVEIETPILTKATPEGA